VPHSRLGRSNIGSRIDCYAWGERIATTGDFDNPRRRDGYFDPNREFFPGVFGFGGTSGASAIIAGVCLLTQHIGSILIPASGNTRLNCAQMRALLRNPANGTSSNSPADKIGTMPDLAKIIANEFLP
jgi:serine protease